MADEIGMAYIVRCSGKAVKTFKSRERAEAYRNDVIDEPELFMSISEWDPKGFYPYVDFEEDKEADNGSRGI